MEGQTNQPVATAPFEWQVAVPQCAKIKVHPVGHAEPTWSDIDVASLQVIVAMLTGWLVVFLLGKTLEPAEAE